MTLRRGDLVDLVIVLGDFFARVVFGHWRRAGRTVGVRIGIGRRTRRADRARQGRARVVDALVGDRFRALHLTLRVKLGLLPLQARVV